MNATGILGIGVVVLFTLVLPYFFWRFFRRLFKSESYEEAPLLIRIFVTLFRIFAALYAIGFAVFAGAILIRLWIAILRHH